jgi:hypothetical protein
VAALDPSRVLTRKDVEFHVRGMEPLKCTHNDVGAARVALRSPALREDVAVLLACEVSDGWVGLDYSTVPQLSKKNCNSCVLGGSQPSAN